MNAEIKKIMQVIIDNGGKPLMVGGCVRDHLLGIPNSDIDIEVFGLDSDSLIKVLQSFGKVDLVGKSFGVLKLTTASGGDYDVSLPRKDNKIGIGHCGFEVEVDHTMTPREAANRRDFTINSMSMDIDGNLIDPFDGMDDLKAGDLVATSDHFSEDPLRAYRAVQFAGRFDMELSQNTIKAIRDMLPEMEHLSLERIREEMDKWAVKSIKPSMGLQAMKDSGLISLYPELESLVDLPQHPEYHPEGCVWTHTLQVVDAAADIATRENLNDEDRLVLILSALCHDLGKSTTTIVEDGRIKSPRHAQEGKNLTISLLTKLGFGDKVIEKVVPLVVCHMDALNFKV